MKAAWSEVVNQYQRRADLIPNLVATVKGFAAQEERVLVEVTEARAKRGVHPAHAGALNDPKAFAQIPGRAGPIDQALSRLIAVSENYPDLKSNANFRDLQAQLEGTENRIAVARNRYIDAVQGLQCDGARVPDQPHCRHVRLRREAEFQRAERSCHFHRARGDLRYFHSGAIGNTGRRRSRARHAAAGELKTRPMKVAWLLVAVLLAGHAPAAHAQIPLPRLEARVTDLTGTLTAAQQSALEDKLAAFEARKGAQIAVLILPTTEPEDIAQFGVRLLESWKLGRKGVDDGAALIVAKDDRAVRIEVQYGLEGVLTDATREPHRQRNHRAAVQAGRLCRRHRCGRRPDAQGRRWRAVARARPAAGNLQAPADSLPKLLVAVLVIATMLRNLIGRAPSALIAGLLRRGRRAGVLQRRACPSFC